MHQENVTIKNKEKQERGKSHQKSVCLVSHSERRFGADLILNLSLRATFPAHGLKSKRHHTEDMLLHICF